jgi:hypothetical protein
MPAPLRPRDPEAERRSAVAPDRTRLFRNDDSFGKPPVVNARNDQRISPWAGSSADNPQQGVVADRQHQPLGEARCRPATERQAQMMDDIFQPGRPARPGRENIIAEPLGEDTLRTMRHRADEPARDHPEVYLLTGAGQVRARLVYRLWIRRGAAPHKGHSRRPSSDLTTKIIESDESLTVSTTNSRGTSEEMRMPVLMVLIPPLENRKLASECHRI